MSRTETVFCGCCCPDGKHCFQVWTAVWSCDDLDWTGPTPGVKTCRTATSGAWTKTSSTDTTCTYTKYVQMGKCCTVNGDCTGEANTATPALPYGGGPPSDCPCGPCVGSCGCFNIGATATASFADVATIGCLECPHGDGTSTYKYLTGTLGTYTLNQTTIMGDICHFRGDFTDITYTESVGTSGQPCPTGEVTVGPSTGLHIALDFNAGTGDWTLSAIGEGVILILFQGTVIPADRHTPLRFSNDYTEGDNCGGDAPYGFGGTATVVFTPCVP